jgi:ERCC4-type nuclease
MSWSLRVERWRAIVDTREKAPWTFPELQIGSRSALRAGDYSIEGLSGEISIERKSVDDLVGTMFNDGERFERELGELSAMRWSAVVVECDAADVWAKRYRFSAVPPTAVWSEIARLSAKYPVPFLFLGPRAIAAKCAERLLVGAAERVESE